MGNSYCKIQKDLTGTVTVITGANCGIGLECAREIAKMNGTVVLACRTEEKAQPILKELREKYPDTKHEFMRLDLADLDQVVEFAQEFRTKYNKIDILLNNAGIMMPRRKLTTKQGFEIQLGTNHFGHFVLTNQLLPLIKNTPKSRIVNVSSRAHIGRTKDGGVIHFDDLNFDKQYSDMAAYSQSKLANIYFTKSLQQLLNEQNHDIKVVSLHPGVINTNLGRHIVEHSNFALKALLYIAMPFLKTPFQGAQTSLQCCLEDHDKLIGGAYYSDCVVTEPSKVAQDINLTQKFWELSNNLVNNYLIKW